MRRRTRSALFPETTLFRSHHGAVTCRCQSISPEQWPQRFAAIPESRSHTLSVKEVLQQTHWDTRKNQISCSVLLRAKTDQPLAALFKNSSPDENNATDTCPVSVHILLHGLH